MRGWKAWWRLLAITKILTINDSGLKSAGKHLEQAALFPAYFLLPSLLFFLSAPGCTVCMHPVFPVLPPAQQKLFWII